MACAIKASRDAPSSFPLAPSMPGAPTSKRCSCCSSGRPRIHSLPARAPIWTAASRQLRYDAGLAHRQPQHVFNVRRTRRQHHQTVEAERNARALRQAVVERRQEILIDRPAQAVESLLLVHVGLEPRALDGGIGELAESIGELDATGIELEALGHARIAG